MADDWTVSTLRDCAQWYSGGTPAKGSASYWSGTIPWISAKSLTGFFISDSEDRVTDAGAKNGTRLVPKDTILFVVRGMSLKSEFRMGITTRPVTFNQDLKALVAVDGVCPNFLAYAIKARTSEILNLVGEAGHGTGVLPTDRIQGLEIMLPPLQEQRAIAQVVRTLDDKIELNRRMNETLEAMARALFKSWFVDFDPVRAKAEGRDPGLPHHLADLFPSSLVDSELGAIPEGWTVGTLDGLSEIKMGQSPPGASYNDKGVGYPLINGPVQFGEYHPVKALWTTHDNVKLSGDRDLIFCVRGSTTGKRVLSNDVYALGRGVCAIRGRSGFQQYVNWTVDSVLGNLLRKATGSVFPNLSSQDLGCHPVLHPDNRVVRAFDTAVDQFSERIILAHANSSKVAALRDLLLPKLISGELRVGDAERAVECAT